MTRLCYGFEPRALFTASNILRTYVSATTRYSPRVDETMLAGTNATFIPYHSIAHLKIDSWFGIVFLNTEWKNHTTWWFRYSVALVNAVFDLKPIIHEGTIGNAAYFDCTTTTHTNEVFWYYYGVGAKDHEDICLYCFGKVHFLYENKITVERIFGTNSYRLKILSVQREDAGTYICQDNGGIGGSLSAQLVVLGKALITLDFS